MGLDKCIMLHTHHYNIIQSSLSSPESYLFIRVLANIVLRTYSWPGSVIGMGSKDNLALMFSSLILSSLNFMKNLLPWKVEAASENQRLINHIND